MAMLTHIADMRYIITKSETDALALENTLIKKYSPPYNIMLKDDQAVSLRKAGFAEGFSASGNNPQGG